MNMYLHELKSLRKSTIIWTVCLIALAALYFSLYPGLAADAADFKKLLGGYPAPVRAALGIHLDNITSILGFYAMIYSFITLCGAIQGMNYGLSILSKESRERTADFLLVKPVSRAAIVSAKLLAALTMILVTDVLYYAAAVMLANTVKTADFNQNAFFMVNLSLFFLELIFFTIGFFVSVFFTKLRSVLPISLGIVFGLYTIGAVLVTGKDDVARVFSPFKYFDYGYMINNAGFELTYLMLGAVIVVAAIAATYIIYTKKDIHAVS